MSTRSYLVDQFLTVADLAVFFAIHGTVAALPATDKEHYLNISRWFNHLQQDPTIRQTAGLVNFSTLFLIGWADGHHHHAVAK